MRPDVDKEEVVRVFEEIRSRFPHLTKVLDLAPEAVELEMDIPKQEGLGFAINVTLQHDELFLSAGGFFGSWFPCHKQERLCAFVSAVCGLISGRWRIAEYTCGRRLIKATLQEPDDGGWKTRGASQFGLGWLSLGRRTTHVLINARVCDARDGSGLMD